MYYCVTVSCAHCLATYDWHTIGIVIEGNSTQQLEIDLYLHIKGAKRSSIGLKISHRKKAAAEERENQWNRFKC